MSTRVPILFVWLSLSGSADRRVVNRAVREPFRRPKSFREKVHVSIRTILTAAVALLVTACGGGGAGFGDDGGTAPPPSGCSDTTCGTAFISLTDADGDFDSYTVDVVSLSLKKADGSSVDALSVKSRVDLADLVDLKEFVTAATIPNGSYVSGTLRLDFTNADILVDVNGVPTHAVAVDANGNALTTVDLDIQLDNKKQLTIAPGTPALLELDFDLLASNAVDLTKNPIQVMVQPFIVASVDVADSREARVRGPLVSVNTTTGDYHIDLRPFHLTSGRLGDVTVHTTAQTEFEIDGTSFTGSAGVAALAALATGSPTAAYGTLDVAQKTFTATRVHAGTSVAGSQFDVIQGNVVARSGSNLTVGGVTLIKKDGSAVFKRGTTTLVVGPNTKVTKDGERDTTQSLTTDSISVGQRIHAFGTATESGDDVTVDATAGRVRMHLTHLLGTVKSTLPGSVTLDLGTIDGRPASVFNFAGTGVQPAQDALASDYEVDTGILNLSNLDVGSAARVFGFVTPFGDAPPDFTARTLVDFRDVQAVLSVGYGIAGTNAPFLTVDATNGLVVDNHNSRIGARHFIAVGPRLIDIKALGSSPTIKPETGNGNVFAIGEPRRVEVFTTFADFVARLNSKLLAQKVIAISATGSYDEATNVLTAHRVLVEMTAN
jgi:hypothetical protein